MEYIYNHYNAFFNYSKKIEVTKKKIVYSYPEDDFNLINLCKDIYPNPLMFTEAYDIYFNNTHFNGFLKSVDNLFDQLIQEIKSNLSFPENTKDDKLKYLQRISASLSNYNNKIKSEEGKYSFDSMIVNIPEDIRDLIICYDEADSINFDPEKNSFPKPIYELRDSSDNKFISNFLYELKLQFRRYLTDVAKLQSAIIKHDQDFQIQEPDAISKSQGTKTLYSTQDHFEFTNENYEMQLGPIRRKLIKEKLIGKETLLKDLNRLFDDKPFEKPIRWTSSQKYLRYFILCLEKKNIILKKGRNKWAFVCVCFVKPDHKRYDPKNLRTAKSPKDQKVIDTIIKLFNPLL
jgi:hypothetical protein